MDPTATGLKTKNLPLSISTFKISHNQIQYSKQRSSKITDNIYHSFDSGQYIYNQNHFFLQRVKNLKSKYKILFILIGLISCQDPTKSPLIYGKLENNYINFIVDHEDPSEFSETTTECSFRDSQFFIIGASPRLVERFYCGENNIYYSNTFKYVFDVDQFLVGLYDYTPTLIEVFVLSDSEPTLGSWETEKYLMGIYKTSRNEYFMTGSKRIEEMDRYQNNSTPLPNNLKELSQVLGNTLLERENICKNDKTYHNGANNFEDAIYLNGNISRENCP